jgi:hypothetical protein
MSATVTHLRSDPVLVEMLEKLLADARTGVLRTVAVVWVNRAGDPVAQWCVDAPRDTHAFTAGIGDMFYRVHTRRHQQAYDSDDDDPAS